VPDAGLTGTVRSEKDGRRQARQGIMDGPRIHGTPESTGLQTVLSIQAQAGAGINLQAERGQRPRSADQGTAGERREPGDVLTTDLPYSS
jgi:hypothetical protein